MKETTVLIVEPDLDTQRIYRQRLIHDPEIRLIGICSSMASATALLMQTCCDILITELALPDGPGIELVRRATKEFFVPNVAVMTERKTVNDIVESIENGAIGYILKTENSLHSVADYVRSIIAGGSPVSPFAARVIIQAFHNRQNLVGSRSPTQNRPPVPNPLSPRETEVLNLLTRGMSFVEISQALNISTHTVTAHIKKIYRKLQVHSRGEAVYQASQMGILSE